MFAIPPKQICVEQSHYTEIMPVSALTDLGPVEFFIPGDGKIYPDISGTLLQLKLKITNTDGLNLAADAPVGCINYPLNTIFSQTDVTLRHRLISQSSTTCSYRAMIKVLMNFLSDTLKSQFSAGCSTKTRRPWIPLLWHRTAPKKAWSAEPGSAPGPESFTLWVLCTLTSFSVNVFF